MSSDDSDIEMPSALPKKLNPKVPTSPTEELLMKKPKKTKTDTIENQDSKKFTTKEMIHQALTDLHNRKGVSIYAIKKYLTEKYSVDTDKINYHIKKYIKKAVEDGTITQLKGIGASGSFKLIPVKEKKKKEKPKKKEDEKVSKQNSNSVKNPKESKKNSKKVIEIKVVKKNKEKETESEENFKKSKKMKDVSKEKVTKKINAGEDKDVGKIKKTKIAKQVPTPVKKMAAKMKRKSIGSIIKPPKMKPKAKA